MGWKIVNGTSKGSWKPYWLDLLKHLQDGIPHDWFVIVTTDRGLYASWFYEAIVALGWHPMMRINHQGYYRPIAESQFLPLSQLITQVGQRYCAPVTCFKYNSLECTLMASWESNYADPWLVVTDLPASNAQICWYGMRSWLECLFKDIKRGGLGWHHTKMSDPQRAERLWLAIAVATLWLVSLGGQTNNHLPVNSLEQVEFDNSEECSNFTADFQPLPAFVSLPTPACNLSLFRRGFLHFLASAIRQIPLTEGSFTSQFSLSSG